MTNVSSALDKVMADLSVKPSDMLEEGVFDFMKPHVANAQRQFSDWNRNRGIDAEQAKQAKLQAADARHAELGTATAIAKDGSIFVTKDGQFIGLPYSIKPETPLYNYIASIFANEGIHPIAPEQRAQVANQRINVLTPDKLPGNLKTATMTAMGELVKAIQTSMSAAKKSEYLAPEQAQTILNPITHALQNAVNAIKGAQPKDTTVPQQAPQQPAEPAPAQASPTPQAQHSMSMQAPQQPVPQPANPMQFSGAFTAPTVPAQAPAAPAQAPHETPTEAAPPEGLTHDHYQQQVSQRTNPPTNADLSNYDGRFDAHFESRNHKLTNPLDALV